jgi:hypothetical protein
MKTCFACHEKAKVSDLVFTHYAPEAQNVYLADPPYGNGKCQKTGVTGVDLGGPWQRPMMPNIVFCRDSRI